MGNKEYGGQRKGDQGMCWFGRHGQDRSWQGEMVKMQYSTGKWNGKSVIRVKLPSRHKNSKTYFIYVLSDEKTVEEWYCSCNMGMRTAIIVAQNLAQWKKAQNFFQRNLFAVYNQIKFRNSKSMKLYCEQYFDLYNNLICTIL